MMQQEPESNSRPSSEIPISTRALSEKQIFAFTVLIALVMFAGAIMQALVWYDANIFYHLVPWLHRVFAWFAPKLETDVVLHLLVVGTAIQVVACTSMCIFKGRNAAWGLLALFTVNPFAMPFALYWFFLMSDYKHPFNETRRFFVHLGVILGLAIVILMMFMMISDANTSPKDRLSANEALDLLIPVLIFACVSGFVYYKSALRIGWNDVRIEGAYHLQLAPRQRKTFVSVAASGPHIVSFVVKLPEVWNRRWYKLEKDTRAAIHIVQMDGGKELARRTRDLSRKSHANLGLDRFDFVVTEDAPTAYRYRLVCASANIPEVKAIAHFQARAKAGADIFTSAWWEEPDQSELDGEEDAHHAENTEE